MSKNAFADIGFDDRDASEMALRVAVAVQIKRLIQARRLSQGDARALFGVPQPTISKIVNLRLDRVSLTLLLRMLFKAGVPFHLVYGGTPQAISAQVEGALSVV